MVHSFSPFRTLILISTVVTVALVCAVLWDSPQSAQEHNFLPDKFAVADEITLAIRDRSTRIFAVRVEDASDREEAERSGRILADHGSFVLVASREAALGKDDWQTVDTTINLPGSMFDPMIDPTSVSAVYQENSGYYVVQFGVTPTDELLDSLRSAGVEVIQYVPHQAFFVYGKSDAIDRVSLHSRVRWVGKYLPEQKPSTVLRSKIAAFRHGRKVDRGISPIERTGRNSAVFDVAVFANADLATAATSIALTTGGRVRHLIPLANNFFNVVRIEASIDRIESAAKVEAVFSIEAWSQPRREDEIASHIVAGNYAGNTVAPPGYDPLMQFGVNGLNTTVAVVDDGVGIPGDGGFYITASNAKDGPLRGATSGAQGHGHLQASIIAGDLPFSDLDPDGYNYGSGMAPKASIVNIPFLRLGYSGTDADAVNDVVATTGTNGVPGYISNNSWGDGTNDNEYDLYAAQYDGFVRDASSAASIDPLVIVFSAGNSGFGGLTRPKVAKNVIAVAATENIRPTLPTSGGTTGVADNIEQVPDFSSRGPAADTRIKPDIAAPGAAITGGRSGPGISGMSIVDDYHRVSSGTSHAAPLVAGAAALFTEFWKGNNSGVNPSPAMVKAALINGAVEVTGQGANEPRPNGAEGWGRVNLKNVLNTGTAMSYFDQSMELGDVGVIRNFTGTVADDSRPLRVSLVWTDPPGAEDPALVNDLDLEVLVGGNKYRGNVFISGSSTTGGVADNLNNVENVFLPAGVSGQMTIRVITKSLNGNGILGNADPTDQHFALVVYNGNVTESSLASPEGGEPFVITGNNLLEPNECNLVSIPVTNLGGSTATSVTATLSTTTPGVTITVPNATYPNIAPGATVNGVSPFQVSTTNSVACATNVDLVLTVSHAGMVAPAVFNYTVGVGAPPPDPNYVFTSTNGATISPGGTLIAGSDADEVVLDVPAPFAFSVYDTAVASGSIIRVSDNGHIRIETSGSATAADVNTSLPASASGAFPAALPVLMPYWDDLDMRPVTLSGGGIYSEVTGSPGSRTWKLEWRARNWRAPQLGNVVNVQFAVYFHENSNDFEYVYALTGGGVNSSGALATVGVQGAATGSLFTQHSFNSASLSAGLQLAASRPVGECAAGFGPCVSTAAPVEVSGRVETSSGRGIRGAQVTLIGSDGSQKSAATNTFGYFRFENVASGNGYVLSVTARGYQFAPIFFDATDTISNLVLTAQP